MECASLEVVELDEKDTASISNFDLNINQNKTEGDLSQVLMQLLESSNLEQNVIEQGKIAINKHSANNQITKSRLRDDCFSSHRNQDLFFYLPSFCSDGKANLSKAWSTIGNISPDDKFDPNEKKAAIMCVLNYELLEKIIKKIKKLIIISKF